MTTDNLPNAPTKQENIAETILATDSSIHSTSVLKSGVVSQSRDTAQSETDAKDSSAYLKERIIAERVVEKDVLLPVTEDNQEEGMKVQRVKQKVIEVAKKRVVEKVVEVPEYEYREKIVSVLEKVRQERIKEVPVIEYQERITEVPKIVYKEKEVKVPEYEYVEVVNYRDVEVVTHEEEHIIKEVVKPVIVEVPTPEYVEVDDHVRVDVNVPYPVESIIELEVKLPKLNVMYKKIEVPIAVPKFVEIPVPQELFPNGYASFAESQKKSLMGLIENNQFIKSGIPQTKIVNIDNEIRGTGWDELFTDSSSQGIDAKRFIDQAMKNNEFLIDKSSFNAAIKEATAKEDKLCEELEAKYQKKLRELEAEKDKELHKLRQEVEAKRNAAMEAAFERARAQAISNLTAAGLEPDEYLNDTFAAALAEQSAAIDSQRELDDPEMITEQPEHVEEHAPTMEAPIAASEIQSTSETPITTSEITTANETPMAASVIPVVDSEPEAITPVNHVKQTENITTNEYQRDDEENENQKKSKKRKKKAIKKKNDQGPIEIEPHNDDNETFRMMDAAVNSEGHRDPRKPPLHHSTSSPLAPAIAHANLSRMNTLEPEHRTTTMPAAIEHGTNPPVQRSNSNVSFSQQK